MKNRNTWALCPVCLLSLFFACGVCGEDALPDAGDRVRTWAMNAGLPDECGYRVMVNGKNLDVVGIPKSSVLPEGKAFPYSFATFDADEEVLVEIYSPLNLKRMRISPMRNAAKDIRATETCFSFRAKPPFKWAFEPLPYVRHRALIIVANTCEKDAPKPGDKDVIYFGPGRHRLEKCLDITSGQTLYLAPGCWLEGAICAQGTNVTICGRGVISGIPWPHKKGPTHDMVNMRGKNVVMRDITLTGSWFYTLALERVEGALVDNITILGGRCNNDDGFDPIWAKDVTLRNSFIRTHDDSIAPKDMIENLTVENCSLWADGANPIRLGFECAGGPTKPFRHIRFSNIEILHQSLKNDVPPDAYWVEAAIHLQPSNGMVFEDILFENFQFEMFPQAADMFLVARTRPCRNGPDIHREGGHIRGITFRNIVLSPRRPLGALGVWLEAYDKDHFISDVTFENVQNFQVPLGIHGRIENVKGLPRGLVRGD